MRKKILVGFLCGCVLLLATGCGSEAEVEVPSKNEAETVAFSEHNQKEDTEKLDVYGKLIADVRESIRKMNDSEATTEPDDFSGALLRSGENEIEGYWIEDLNGDGIDELIFGVNSDGQDTVIYDLYTLSGGNLVHVLNGWERNRYYICENGMIANEGSSSGFNSNYSYFTFDGSKLLFVESVIYDGIKDAENPCFYSTESEYETDNAKPISEEEAAEIRDNYIYKSLAFHSFIEDK